MGASFHFLQWPHVRCCWFGRNNLLAYRNGWFLANQSSHFVIQRGHNFWQTFHPSGRPARRHVHLHSILKAKHFSARVRLNVQLWLDLCGYLAPSANGNIVLAHSLSHSAHELASRIDLQHLWPLERACLYILQARATSSDSFEVIASAASVPAGHIYNSQGVLVNLLSSRKLSMGQEEKISLVHLHWV